MIHRRDLSAIAFPPFPCVKNIGVSPYTLSPPELVNGQICFTVNVVKPSIISPCNKMDFYKLVLDVRKSSSSSIIHLVAAHTTRSTSYGYDLATIACALPAVTVLTDPKP